MRIQCDPSAIRGFKNSLSSARECIRDALNSLKADYMRLDWEDKLALTTERLLNAHIGAMNRELRRLGRMIATLDMMLEETDVYTDRRTVDLSR